MSVQTKIENYLNYITGSGGGWPTNTNIGIMAGVGAPTSLAVDLAKRFDMTLLGFVKESSFNIYNNKKRIILS